MLTDQPGVHHAHRDIVDIAEHRIDLLIAMLLTEICDGAMGKVIIKTIPVQFPVKMKIPGIPVLFSSALS